MIRKLLKYLLVIQEQPYKDAFNRTGFKRRINPYNPISYISIITMVIIGLIMFGLVGFWQEVDLRNPFKYR